MKQPERILNRADHYRLQLKVSDLINLISDLALARGCAWRAGGPAFYFSNSNKYSHLQKRRVHRCIH